MEIDPSTHPLTPLVNQTEEVRLFAMRGTLAALRAAPIAGRKVAARSLRRLARKERSRGKPFEAYALLSLAKQVIRLKP